MSFGAGFDVICLGVMVVNRRRCTGRLLEQPDLIVVDQRRKHVT